MTVWYIIGYLLIGMGLVEGVNWASKSGDREVGPYMWLLLGWPLVILSLIFSAVLGGRRD